MTDFPVQLIRDQFPALQSGVVFLDNPGGTQVPNGVIHAISSCLGNAMSNTGGHFDASSRADAVIDNAYAAAAEFLGAESGQEILIGQSTTMLTFQMSRSLARNWSKGDEIIVTQMDHEANISPWLTIAAEIGLNVRWLPVNKDTWQVDVDDLKALLNEKTRLVALNYASNLTGSINPVRELTKVAKESGCYVYVDAVQYAPHGLIDVKALGCDFLVCSSYKFFGPHLGVLWGKAAILQGMYPYAVRCAPKTLPSRHATGTAQTELFAGLAAAIDHMVWLGGILGNTGNRRSKIAAAYEAAQAYEADLTKRLIDGLRGIDGIRVHGIVDHARIDERVPTVSVTHASKSSDSLAQALAAKGVNVWSGNHYAIELTKLLGINMDDGVLRFGIAHYNTSNEIERAVSALKSSIE